jgi:hypothetical protein
MSANQIMNGPPLERASDEDARVADLRAAIIERLRSTQSCRLGNPACDRVIIDFPDHDDRQQVSVRVANPSLSGCVRPRVCNQSV